MISTFLSLGKQATLFALLVVSGIHAPIATSMADDYEGFIEPYRDIEFASDEVGVIRQLMVREGDRIEAGQLLVELDRELYEVQLDIAQHNANSVGRVQAAESEKAHKEKVLTELKKLRAEGFARESELQNAQLEYHIAESRLIAEREEQQLRQLQLTKAKVDLQRRSLVSPVSGVVAKVFRDQGEYVSNVAPEILSLMQTDLVLATFNLARYDASQFEHNQSIPVQTMSGEIVYGQIESIGVVTDAQSGTVKMKIKIVNSEQKLKPGDHCYLNLKAALHAATIETP